MSLYIFTEDDKKIIEKKLPEIVEEAQYHTLKNTEPNIDEITTILKLIIDKIVIKNKRVIFGKYAYNMLMDINNVLTEIHIYSSDPVKDLYDLSKYLFENDYKYITFDNKFGFFILSVNMKSYCHIHYLHQSYIDVIPTLIMDKVQIVHPHYQIMLNMKILSDPIKNYDDFEEIFDQLYNLQKKYPLTFEKYPINLKENSSLKKINLSKYDLIYCGIDAYNYYIQVSELKEKKVIPQPFIQAYSLTYKDTKHEIMKEYFNENITQKVFKTYSDIYLDDILLLRLYDGTDKCISFNLVSKADGGSSGSVQGTQTQLRGSVQGTQTQLRGKMKYVSFDLLLSMYLSDMFRDNYELYKTLSCNLIHARDSVLEKNKSILDDTPFKIFVVKFCGIHVNPDVENRLKVNFDNADKEMPTYEYDNSIDELNIKSKINIPLKPKNFIYLFTEEDYKLIIKELPNIIDSIKLYLLKNGTPSLDEVYKIQKLILEYVKKNNRIIYGGYALDKALRAINPEHAIYKKSWQIPDIEFYSPEPMKDIVDICDILVKQDLQNIIFKESLHEETYSLKVNGRLYCDISYIPKLINGHIRKIEFDGINYVHPHFGLIDLYRMINDPLTSYWRLETKKTFQRMYILQKDYPLEAFKGAITYETIDDEETKLISMFNKDYVSDTLVYCGFETYNYYLKESGNNHLIDILYIQAITTNYKEEVPNIINYFKTKSKNITYIEYFPFFQFLGSHTEILNNNKVIAKIYHHNDMCIPRHIVKNMNYATFDYLTMIYMMLKFKMHVEKNMALYKGYGIMITNLILARDRYFEKNNKNPIDKTPYQSFVIPCIGRTMTAQRKAQLKYLEKLKNKKTPIFTYDPRTSKEKDIKWIFKNTSGNVVNTDMNKKFTEVDGKVVVKIKKEKIKESKKKDDEEDFEFNLDEEEKEEEEKLD